MTNKNFEGYRGRECDYWIAHHDAYPDSILAVGRGNASPAVNQAEYEIAGKQFRQMVEDDFPGNRSSLSALDLGYGHGHYARACGDLGFGSYLGLDFAAQLPDYERDGFAFRHQDISAPLYAGKFDLVFCIDVIFHIVDDLKFEKALSNLKASAKGFIYVTSLFHPFVAKPYVKHRSMREFSDVLGPALSLHRWRDNSIARFKVSP